MGGLSIGHWLIVLVVVVLIFGTKKLRNIGSDLGGALRDFRKGMNDPDPTPPNSQLKADPPTTTPTVEGENKPSKIIE